jgi:hypothetical protein
MKCPDDRIALANSLESDQRRTRAEEHRRRAISGVWQSNRALFEAAIDLPSRLSPRT